MKVREEAYFGSGSGPILLDDLMCVGNETDLTSCGNAFLNRPNCRHNEDVGVECQGMSTRCRSTLSFYIVILQICVCIHSHRSYNTACLNPVAFLFYHLKLFYSDNVIGVLLG